MKNILLLISMLVACSLAGTLRDPRDGQTYKTVKIGNQEWMAENLNYKTGGSMCYKNNPENCRERGRLYTWAAAKKACPSGWHLPTGYEFDTLVTIAGDEEKRKRGFSDKGESGSNLRARGNDKFGFSAIPAGEYYGNMDYFNDLDRTAKFWSSTENHDQAFFLDVFFGKGKDAVIIKAEKIDGFSVRCIKNTSETHSTKKQSIIPSSSSMKDIRDGQTYKTMKIGRQVWMVENLNYNIKGSKCLDDKQENCDKYGRLYSWLTARNVCPSGWHLPSKEAFEELSTMVYFEGEKLCLHCSDKFGFLTQRTTNDYIALWSSTEKIKAEFSAEYDYEAFTVDILQNSSSISHGGNLTSISVRCLQDSDEKDAAATQAQPLKAIADISHGTETMTDSRDGQTYKTVKIGDQVWMAENLNYETSGSVCYENNPENCEKYGRLYSWEAALNACPAGWYLPRKEEFETLLSMTRNQLRVRNWNSFDEFDFSALPAGSYDDRKDPLPNTYFWSSTLNKDYSSTAYALHINEHNVYIDYNDTKFSIRCLKSSGDENEPAIFSSSSSSVKRIFSTGSFTDSRNGQKYKTVKIGNQNWMAENLNYQTGNSWCYANNAANCKKSGRLYDWETAKNACPAGWRLPDDEEWHALWKSIGGKNIAGTKLKSQSGWNKGGNGSDVFGFSVLPTGHRTNGGDFYNEDYYASFWCATERDNNLAYDWYLSYNDANLSRYYSNKNTGFSVRCIQDSNSSGINSKPRSKAQPSNANANQTRIKKKTIVYENNEPKRINNTKETESKKKDATSLSIDNVFFNLALGLGYHGLSWGWESEKYNNNDELTGTGIAKDFQLKFGYLTSEKLIPHIIILGEWANVTFSTEGYELEKDVSELIFGAGVTYYFTENWNVGGSIGYGKIRISPFSMEGLVAQANIGFDYWINDNMAIGGSCSLQIARAVEEVTETDQIIGTPKSISFLLTFSYLKNHDYLD